MKKTSILLAAAALLQLVSFSPVLAEDAAKSGAMATPVTVGDLSIDGAWTKAMLPGQKVGGGFLTIANKGSADDRLVSAASAAAPNVQIHEMAVVNDVMEMRQLPDGIAIPAGQTVELKPGGLHLMFMDVSEPFKEGGMVPVTITFEKAGKAELMLPVAPAGVKEMPEGHMDHGG